MARQICSPSSSMPAVGASKISLYTADRLMMSCPTRFENGRVILPDGIIEDGAVVCVDGLIRQLGPRQTFKGQPAGIIDAGGGFIAPGYVDLHVHGGDGSDYMDGTPEAVLTANRAHGRCGTTTIFPTTTTGSREQISAMLRACRTVRDNWQPSDGARIAGVHFYGPYFAQDKVGCHPATGRRDPDPREYQADFDLGMIQIATCAAELPGALTFYRAAAERGYLVTCGHSNASWGEMQLAFEAGMRHVDHFWCAMSSVPSVRSRFGTPMQGSMAEFVLMNREMSTEVIADGCHLAPELLQFAFTMKGAQRLCLVSDANRALGMPPGEYAFGPVADGQRFVSDGRVGYIPGQGLASSILPVSAMVRNMYHSTDAEVWQAVRMGSLTPAERAEIAAEVGSLEVGKRADVLILDADLDVQQVFISV